MTSLIQPCHPTGKGKRARRFTLLVAMFATVCFCHSAIAFENLTEAQTLIYDTPHLANTESGQVISYTYSADSVVVSPSSAKQTGQPADSLTDKVVLSVLDAHADNKRDVSVEFLSGERKLPLPDFRAYRGNPVIIAMLEHIALSMSRETGGGTLYFRNRIKDGLAGADLKVSEVAVQHSDKKISARQFSFSPFSNDAYLAEKPQYTGSVFTFTLSDEVPGGVLEVSVSSATVVENGFQHSLTLD